MSANSLRDLIILAPRPVSGPCKKPWSSEFPNSWRRDTAFVVWQKTLDGFSLEGSRISKQSLPFLYMGHI